MGPNKKYHYINSVKKSDKDLLKQLLEFAGIEVTEEQCITLYSLFCDGCGTEFFAENVLKPAIIEMKIRNDTLTPEELYSYFS